MKVKLRSIDLRFPTGMMAIGNYQIDYSFLVFLYDKFMIGFKLPNFELDNPTNQRQFHLKQR